MRYLIALIWLAIFTKKLFFWVYLWQLKEYHIGRFIDHFQTYKGKKLIFNYLLLVKVLLLLGMIYTARHGLEKAKFFLVYFTAFVFFAESLYIFRAFLRKTLKKPVLTQKIAVILSTGFSSEILLVFTLFLLEFRLTKFTATLLLVDILTPIGFSMLVLAFQPLAVFLRNRILKQAKLKRAKFLNLITVGITGSYGKTSTKEFLAAILSEKFRVLKTKEHQNSEVGISECIINELRPEHQIFICEMGAYNRGGIKLLCDIAKPKIGILTGINEQHMATFGSQENIIKAKYELIESLPQDGVAFFNGKNKYCLELYQKTLRPGSGQASIKKHLYGENSGLGLENFEGAKAVAKELGMTDQEIESASRKIENKFPGIKIKDGVNGLKIIDATYSANPDGVIANLEYLKTLPGKKIIVMPCLIELGKASAEVHRRIGQKIAEVCDLAIITTKDRFKEIKDGTEVGLPSMEVRLQSILFLEDPKAIFEKIKSTTNPGDVVLLESRVPSALFYFLGFTIIKS
ncbi:MAG: Mur ligase family protein [bacterium]|nr:Mur ligase family protein [bacterium]